MYSLHKWLETKKCILKKKSVYSHQWEEWFDDWLLQQGVLSKIPHIQDDYDDTKQKLQTGHLKFLIA